MSSSVADAQHLQKMDLHLRQSDINFLQSILPCLANSQSLQELDVWCDASGVFSGCATHTCICTFLHTHKHHTLEHTTPITCLQSECVHAVLTNHICYVLSSGMCDFYYHLHTSSPASTHTHTQTFLLPSFFSAEFGKVTPKWRSKAKESISSTGLGCRSDL